MEKKKNKNNVLLIIGLVLLIVVIGVGYASLYENLEINGTANIGKSTWSITFDNIQPVTGSVTPSTPPYVMGETTTLSYTVALNKPGDFYEFRVDVVNEGSLSAALTSQTLTGGESYNFIIHDVKMVSGSNLIAVPSDLVLAPHGETGDTITLDVKVEYDRENASAEYLSATIPPINLQYAMNFEQA